MEIAVRQPAARLETRRATAHRCPQCRADALLLLRRHVSPPQWGEPVVTEYYECDYCEARFTFSPADNRWRFVYL